MELINTDKYAILQPQTPKGALNQDELNEVLVVLKSALSGFGVYYYLSPL